jgi:hypothetical protein
MYLCRFVSIEQENACKNARILQIGQGKGYTNFFCYKTVNFLLARQKHYFPYCNWVEGIFHAYFKNFSWNIPLNFPLICFIARFYCPVGPMAMKSCSGTLSLLPISIAWKIYFLPFFPLQYSQILYEITNPICSFFLINIQALFTFVTALTEFHNTL